MGPRTAKESRSFAGGKVTSLLGSQTSAAAAVLEAVQHSRRASQRLAQAPLMAAPLSPQDQPMLDVALLFAGGLRDFHVDLAHKLSRNVLMPLSRSTTTLDMFACNEPGDHFRPDSRRIIQESGVKLFELEAWSFSWLNQTDGGATQAHAFVWALRVEKCYQASRRTGSVDAARGVERRYDFFVRLRPDLLWEEALGAVSTWSTSSISMRMRAYSVSARRLNPGATTDRPIHCALSSHPRLVRGRGRGASRPPWARFPRPSVGPPFTLTRSARKPEPNASS